MSSACLSFFRPNISASGKMLLCSIWLSPFPARPRNNFRRMAKELRIVLIASLFEKRAPGVYHNTALMFDTDGSLAGVYRKMHIPDDPLYYEKFYFTPGDLGFKAFDTAVGRIGTLVCWDQWYPEGARLTALQGAQVLFYPTAIGWHPAEKAGFGEAQHDAWRTIQRAHAIANGVYVAVVNRVGHETGDIRGKAARARAWNSGEDRFSAIPSAGCIAEASHDKEEILVGRSRPARHSKKFAATGRFCATAASTATRRSPAG